MQSLVRKLALGVSTTALLVGAPQIVSAQESAAEASAEDNLVVEEIVVTAQKREQSLKDVQLAVKAIDGDQLVKYNQLSIKDYFASVPGLSFTDGGNGSQRVSIRGLSTGGAVENPSVSYVIDDVPFGSASGLGFANLYLPDIDPFDLERVEVLRGPQGTLYGAASIGGLVKFVTKRPDTEEFAGRVEANTNIIENGDIGYGFRASFNVPLNDTFALRASGFYREEAGFVDNITTGDEDINSGEAYGGRLSLLWNPSDNVNILLGALYQQRSADGANNVDTDFTFENNLNGDLVQTNLAGTGVFEITTQLYTATMDFDLDGLQFTSLSAFGMQELEQNTQLLSFGGALNNIAETERFTQEFRLSSYENEMFGWQVGAFYSNDDSPVTQFVFTPGASGALDFELLRTDFNAEVEELAGFFDLEVRPTERLTLQFGGRYAGVWQDYQELTDFTLLGAGIIRVDPISMNEEKFTYSASAGYELTDDVSAYARLATGFRIGGLNPSAQGLGIPDEFGSDETTNYELGFKGALFDGRVSFDLAAFYIDWTDIQVSLVDAATGLGFLDNAGEAESMGIELSSTMRFFEGNTITTNIAVTDAEITTLDPTASLAAADGDSLPFVADFTFNLNVDQDFAINDDVMGYAGATFNYIGDRPGAFPAAAGVLRAEYGDYVSLDFRLGLTYEDWELNFNVTNLTDERGVVGGGAVLGAATTLDTASNAVFINPRTFALTLSKRF